MAPRRASDDAYDAPRTQSRLTFELILGGALLVVGLLVMPAAVFMVGQALLGPYGDVAAGTEAAGLGTFYADFFGDLASGSGRTWALVLGPLILISCMRLLFLKSRGETQVEQDTPPPPPPQRRAPPRPQPRQQAQTPSRRVEPRIS